MSAASTSIEEETTVSAWVEPVINSFTLSKGAAMFTLFFLLVNVGTLVGGLAGPQVDTTDSNDHFFPCC
jgi:hypothetical protein